MRLGRYTRKTRPDWQSGFRRSACFNEAGAAPPRKTNDEAKARIDWEALQ